MGKSVRSKQQRINRSNRRNLIHKPVEDKRLERLLEKGLADKLITLPVEEVPAAEVADARMEAAEDRVLTQKEKRDLILNRNQKKKKMRKVRGVKMSKTAKKFE